MNHDEPFVITKHSGNSSAHGTVNGWSFRDLIGNTATK